MATLSPSRSILIILALVAATTRLYASDPIGIYGVVDKVVFEPNESNPSAVQIWGAFALAVPRSPNGVRNVPAGSFGSEQGGDLYSSIQKGYLYYSCPASKQTACANEWSDLKMSA